jgi:dipeptidyl aminopeptidase/acylaminoacyl peptidase
MADLRRRLGELDRVEVPDVWQRVRLLGPRSPEPDRPRRGRRALAATVALLIAGAGIALAVRALGRSPAPPAAPRPTAHAIVFGLASSDSLDARYEIASVAPGGGDVVPLTSAGAHGMVAAEPRWSPDGSRIAFVMSPRGHLPRYAGDGAIYVMNANGSGIRRLTSGWRASWPAWSPDGSRIVFVRNQGEELVVMDSDGSNQQVIARNRGYYQLPSWSPDGKTILYQSRPLRHRRREFTAVFTIRSDGTGERQLTRNSDYATSPAWSPDGSRIAYSSGGLWVMNADGSQSHRVTRCCADFAPAWSPDAGDLVFVRQEDGGGARRLYVVQVATGSVRPLTPGVRWASSPSWRP